MKKVNAKQIVKRTVVISLGIGGGLLGRKIIQYLEPTNVVEFVGAVTFGVTASTAVTTGLYYSYVDKVIDRFVD